jgi:ferredoxin-fold anticodon binding domain-containing protein
MTDLTGKKIANTYKDLLQINSSASNSGVDGTLRIVQDGGGKSTSLKLSQTEAAFSGNVSVNGNMTVIGTFQPDTINASEIGVSTLSATNITTDTLTAETLTFQDVSVSSLRAGTVSATTLAATTNITLAGDNVATSASLAATSAELRGAIVSIESIISSNVAYVSAAQVSVLAVIQGMQNNISTNSTHINTVSATLSATDDRLKTSIANVSAALETRIAAVSAEVSAVKALVTATNASAIAANTSAISVNSAAITSINAAISAGAYASAETSANLETRINAVSVLAETKASASTSVNLETRINAVSILAETKASASTSVNLETRINAVSVLAETKASASTSVNLETRINAVSAITKTNADAITSINTAISAGAYASASTSANLETRINAVSVLAETKASASTSVNLETRINAVSVLAETKASASTSANVQTQIATLSATMATSISNHLPLSGGTLTGALTLNADPTVDLGAATKQYVDNLTAAGIHLHDAVRVETPSALTATYDNGTAGVGATLTNSGTQAALSIDGITLSTSDRVLVRQQSNQAHNGVYVVTNVGSASTNWILTRSDDADSAGDGSPDTLDEGSYFFVNEGDTGASDAYVCNTQGTITFGTTNITFAKFSDSLEYTAGTGININASRVIATSGVATTTQLAALSATLATSIANVSALIPTSLTELNISDGTNGQVLQTDGNSNFTFVSIAAGGSGGSGTMTELKAGTNIALVENGTTVTETTTSATINVVGVASAGTSATLESRINAVSVLAETKASASTSANLETRINAVSVLAETKASASTSVNLETRINAVSVLAETKASASTSVNLQTRIAAVSATMATSISNSNTAIATLSATMATSIGNQLPKAGGTITGNLVVGDGTDISMSSAAAGQVRVAGSGYSGAIALDGNGMHIYHNSSGRYMAFGINETEEMRLETDGDLHVDGNVVAYSTTISDKRLKKDIQPIENALWRVNQLTGCTFTYLKDDRKSAGLIAQDVEKVLPSAVIDTEAVFHGEEGETYKTLQYDQVIGLLVEAVKELAAKVEELENASSR